jgi:hypothetical protein
VNRIMHSVLSNLTRAGASLITTTLALSTLFPADAQALNERAAESGHSDRSFDFRTVNFAGDTFTQLLGINSEDEIAGYHGSGAAGHPNIGFTLRLPGKFTLENFPNSAQTQVIGINQRGSTDGFYIDAAGTTHGFTDIEGVFANVDFPGTTFNQLLGLNNLNQAAGYYADAAGIDHPYVFDSNSGVFLVITIPAAAGGAQATAINNRQSVAGFYIDAAGANHGFLLSDGKLTTLDFPDSALTQALGVNDHNEVVGFYMDQAGLTHGFRYCEGHFQSIDDPSGVGATTVNGINDQGDIVGFYVDSDGNTDGLVGFPQEPFHF